MIYTILNAFDISSLNSTTTTTTACVYLGRQIALPMMGSYTWFSYLIFLVFSLVVLLLFLGWSGCCQICHLSLFSLYHRRVFLCTFRGRVLVIQRFLCIYGITRNLSCVVTFDHTDLRNYKNQTSTKCVSAPKNW